MTFNLCAPAPRTRCHELLTLSARPAESTVSTSSRLGTPVGRRTRLSLWNARREQGGAAPLTQKFVHVLLLQVTYEVPLDFWTRV